MSDTKDTAPRQSTEQSRSVAHNTGARAVSLPAVGILQQKISDNEDQLSLETGKPVKAFQPVQRKENKTGLPDDLKSGIENLSGFSMDHVKVHYNSAQPAQLNALAYAQGSDIHVAPGQEKHLPHEAWHVVQQAQGRVKPTMQMKQGVPVNDDEGLENEADVMGEKAMQFKEMSKADKPGSSELNTTGVFSPKIVQRTTYTKGKITYDTTAFKLGTEKNDRERVTSVVITGTSAKDDTAPNDPVSFYKTEGGKWDDLEGYDRGHVAARQFGGTYASYNIVPMLPNFNTGEWKNEETQIGKLLLNGSIVTVQPNYNATTDARVPNSLTVTSNHGYNKTVNHAVAERDPTTDEDNKFLQENLGKKGTQEYADKVLSDAAKKGFVPPNFKDSPYYVLDVAWLNGTGEGFPWSRMEVKPWQVDWMIRYNKRLNGGTMISDAWVIGTKEPHKFLFEAGRKDRPQVDHIIPALSGGANFFTNFRLISWELNNSIERNVPYDQKSLKWNK